MKAVRLYFTFAILALTPCALGQFPDHRNPPNSDEAAVMKVASRLKIGMREEDVVQLFTTNKLRLHAIIQETNGWARMCCYIDGKIPRSDCFSMTFRQKPSERIIRDSRGLMVMTNGILTAVSLKDSQNTKTNAP